MGCGISIFDYRSQRNATEIGFGHEKQKIDDYGIAQYNSTTGCTKERGEELNGRVVSRKFSSFSSPSKVFLGIARKSTLHGGGERRLVKAKEEPSSNSYNTNEYSIPALQHIKKEAVDADGHDDGATRKSEIVVGEILEIKGVKAAILNEPTSTTKDTIINNAADDDDDQNINNTPTNDDRARARISDYDGPLWIASPSFREYCIADSDSDDDIFKGCRKTYNYLFHFHFH